MTSAIENRIYNVDPGHIQADPNGKTYNLYVSLCAADWEDAWYQLREASISMQYEGVVMVEPRQEEGECGTWIVALQDSDLDEADLVGFDKLHERWTLPEFPNFAIIDIEELF